MIKLGKITNCFWLLIVVISLFVGLGIRIYYGFFTDLWNDEALTYYIARDVPWLDLFFSTGYYWDLVHPPLYYIYTKLVMLFTHQDWFLRLSAFVWFLPSTYLVGSIGSKIGGKRAELVAMSLFALHPLLSGLAFQVRPYTLVIFCMLLFLNLFIGNLQQKSHNPPWLLGIILAVSIYADYAAVWLVLAVILFGFWLLIAKKKALSKEVFKILLFFAIFSSYQIFVLFWFLLAFKGQTIAGSVVLFNSEHFFQELNYLFGFGMILLSIPVPIIVSLVVLKRHNTLANQFLVIVIFSSVLLSVIYSLWRQPIFLAKNLVVASLSLIFILAQFHRKTSNFIMLMIILFIYGKFSLGGYSFLYASNVDKSIKEHQLNNNEIIVSFTNLLATLAITWK